MHRLAATALIGIVGASAAHGTFRPVEDRPYVCDVEETRTTDGVVRHFHLRRTIVFRRTPEGYEATVTLVAIDQSADSEVAAMFSAATGALRGRALRFRLDAAGHILGVDNADAAIDLIADAIARVGTTRGGSAARITATRALAEPLRRAAPAQKVAMLVSVLQPTLAPDETDRVSGVRAVALPGRPPVPSGTPLAGVETVTRNDGSVTIVTQASGVITIADDGGAAISRARLPGVTLRRTRTIDTTTGLLRDARETSDTTIPGESDTHHALIETVIRLRPPAP